MSFPRFLTFNVHFFSAVQNSSASNFHSVVNQFRQNNPLDSSTYFHFTRPPQCRVGLQIKTENVLLASPQTNSNTVNNLYNTFPARIIVQTFVLVAFRQLLCGRTEFSNKIYLQLTFDSIFGQKCILAFDWSANKAQLGSRRIGGISFSSPEPLCFTHHYEWFWLQPKIRIFSLANETQCALGIKLQSTAHFRRVINCNVVVFKNQRVYKRTCFSFELFERR